MVAGLPRGDRLARRHLARRLGQVSEFGNKFDPTVERLVFMVAIAGMLLDGAGPAWILNIVLARELIVGGAVAIATLLCGMERTLVCELSEVELDASVAPGPATPARPERSPP